MWPPVVGLSLAASLLVIFSFGLPLRYTRKIQCNIIYSLFRDGSVPVFLLSSMFPAVVAFGNFANLIVAFDGIVVTFVLVVLATLVLEFCLSRFIWFFIGNTLDFCSGTVAARRY